jgi:hypothetical protein
MGSMQCNVEFGYRLSICSGTKENSYIHTRLSQRERKGKYAVQIVMKHAQTRNYDTNEGEN